ncbi:ATP-binding protein [Actinomadura livida]|uniref:ATP-binding protein n=1 Tax=Actinomadura livida TaxID=79909 RepID=A0A7W7IHW5_9ACTN|nr:MULTISPECIES: ATP-binding protein [Actinomadura]MBB4777431.1 anti-sigma regulatory factor (Ser/Thr protein kinase) [Actinomadura catellatispora]GGU31607.1 ATP-binding protein [Actinomadura livida]
MIVWEGGRTERMCSSGVLDVREVRARVRKALCGCAGGFDLDDVGLMVCEIATNAVRHSASGRPGGGVCVTVLVSAGRLRVEIQDDGGSRGHPMIPAEGSAWDECGRGLLMVRELAGRWGTLRGEDGRHTVWFEVVR